jgi:hypothetical protein
MRIQEVHDEWYPPGNQDSLRPMYMYICTYSMYADTLPNEQI